MFSVIKPFNGIRLIKIIMLDIKLIKILNVYKSTNNIKVL